MVNDLQEKLRSVFKRVFRRDPGDANVSVNDMEEWDSLTHIKLVLELEQEFGIEIDPDSIPTLYSDFSTVLEFLNKNIEG